MKVNRFSAAAVDVYGLGAIFYELLTGHPPFAGSTTMETVRQVLEKEPHRPTALKAGIDVDLETICLKCLAKETSRRYGSAEALAADLDRWLRLEPILARQVSALEWVAKWVRRRPLTAALSTITFLAVAASVAILIRANIHISAARSNEVTLRRHAEGQELIARQRAYASDINLAQQALAENNLRRARELMDRHRPGLTGASDLRGWEWRYLWQQCRSDALFNLARDQGSIYALAVSPDARWLAVGGASGGRLALWDFAERREVRNLAGGAAPIQARFSPAEPLLAYHVGQLVEQQSANPPAPSLEHDHSGEGGRVAVARKLSGPGVLPGWPHAVDRHRRTAPTVHFMGCTR